MPDKSSPFHPIIYVRGYAITQSATNDTTAAPFCGFNLGSAVYRAVPGRDPYMLHYKMPRKFIFESPIVHLASEFGYQDSMKTPATFSIPAGTQRRAGKMKRKDHVHAPFTSSAGRINMTKPGFGTMGVLQAIPLAAMIALGVLGYFMNQATQQSKQALETIQAQVQPRQDVRTAQTGAHNLRLQLFTHASSAIKRTDPRQQEEAKTRALILLLANDLHGGLINALSSPTANEQITTELELVASQERDYRPQQQSLVSTIKEALTGSGDSKTASGEDGSLSQYYIDVFYCQRNEAELKSRAEEIAYSLANKALKTRVRTLADSMNANPGYGITGLQIRYNEAERQAMNALQAALKESNAGEFIPKLVNSPTPHYMSIFVCS